MTPVGGWSATAGETTRRVLEWAAAPSGAPPGGSLRGIGTLTSDFAAREALRRLVRTAAARIGAGCPPFGDAGPAGPGGLVLAAAIGTRAVSDHARRLAELVPPPTLDRRTDTGWTEALARHAVVEPTLGLTLDYRGASTPRDEGRDEPLSEALLRASPLTAVLHRPVDGQNERALDAALGLIVRPHGRRVLAATVCRWSPDHRVMSWRQRLLRDLAAEHWETVVAVYAAARLRHGAEWDQRLSEAGAELNTPGATRPGPLPLATVAFWGALRAHRVRGYLEDHALIAGYEPALMLLRRFPTAVSP